MKRLARIVAKIVGLSVHLRIAHLRKLLYDECVEALSQEFAPLLPSTDPLCNFYTSYIFLKFRPQIVDRLISYTGKLCEVEVKSGEIVAVKPFKSEREIIKGAVKPLVATHGDVQKA